MQQVSPTDHKFYAVREAQRYMDQGGTILLEAVLHDDWIAWVVRIDMPDGKIVRMYNKTTDLIKTYKKPGYIYAELLELGPTELKFELTTPELTKIKAFQQARRALVTEKMTEKQIQTAAMCKKLGVSLATFISILQGERRNPDVEVKICDILDLDKETTFPASISDFLGVEYKLPT